MIQTIHKSDGRGFSGSFHFNWTVQPEPNRIESIMRKIENIILDLKHIFPLKK